MYFLKEAACKKERIGVFDSIYTKFCMIYMCVYTKMSVLLRYSLDVLFLGTCVCVFVATKIKEMLFYSNYVLKKSKT